MLRFKFRVGQAVDANLLLQLLKGLHPLIDQVDVVPFIERFNKYRKLFIRTRRAVLQAQRREDLMALQRWTNTDGQRMISSFVGAFPSMVHIRDHLVAIPFGGADVIEVVPKLQQIVVSESLIPLKIPGYLPSCL